MKKYLVIFAIVTSAFAYLYNPNCAKAYGYGCGFKPFPPLGCDRDDAVCICDEDGDCNWIFICD